MREEQKIGCESKGKKTQVKVRSNRLPLNVCVYGLCAQECTLYATVLIKVWIQQ